ncbi:unnamed protein product [Spirodela intermedia]|uniref:Photosynthetic NDH subcomplex L 2 n=1 Tax=Spirodela intermedia TaxID=51605 RepID=A0A811G885_SPIIN|nr:unnamed protein product [Spirodela intermedia]
MGSFVKHMVMCHAYSRQPSHRQFHPRSETATCSSSTEGPAGASRRWVLASSCLAASALLPAVAQRPPLAVAESWGARSYVREKYFQPEISPEDSVARIRQTAEGLREMKHMLDTMSWRYVLFYIRFKMAYLSSDLKNAMATLPEGRRKPYVTAANELVDNMAELDRYVRTPKVYESYVYYEKTLKSLDDIMAQLA